MEKGRKNTCSSLISAKPEGTEAQRMETCNTGRGWQHGEKLGGAEMGGMQVKMWDTGCAEGES